MLLAVSVALVPLFSGPACSVLGYLVAGVLIGPYGLRFLTDSETIRSISEFGVVIMLFLIGLEVHPAELWRLRNKVLGLGVTQFVVTSMIVAGALLLVGFGWHAAVIIGGAGEGVDRDDAERRTALHSHHRHRPRHAGDPARTGSRR